MNRHKHYEVLIAIAEGKEAEWMDAKGNWIKSTTKVINPLLFTEYEWRVAPQEVPQWRKDLAQAVDDGKVVEAFDQKGNWMVTAVTKEDFLNPNWRLHEAHFRIKPEEPVKQTLYIYNNILNCTSFITHQPPDRVTMIEGLEYMGSIEVNKP